MEPKKLTNDEVWAVIDEVIGKDFKGEDGEELYRGSFDKAAGFFLGYFAALEMFGMSPRHSPRSSGYYSYSWKGVSRRVRLKPVR